jgi:hypothetical protein
MNMLWANITIWYAVVNVVLMFFYTILVSFLGGIDLLYLLKELKDKEIDELDDGRVINSVSEKLQ